MGCWQEACREMTPLVVLWLRIHLPMQETRVQFLIWEDATCRGATKSIHNYCSLESLVPNQSSHHREKFSTETREQPTCPTAREKPAQQRRPSTTKNK